jgi:hypothetical protein
MQTRGWMVLLLMALMSCNDIMNGAHQRHINELIFYKEKLSNLQEILQQNDTSALKGLVNEARSRLLLAEQSLPKTVSATTANLFMSYKKDYNTLSNTTRIYSALMQQIKIATQQNQNLLSDLQNNRLENKTELEMVERECNVAKSILLSYKDFDQSKLKAISDIKQSKDKIDSAIAAITKLKVE